MKPVIMSADFVKEKIILDLALKEDVKVSELRKLFKVHEIENMPVQSLNLEHQNVLNIAYLWRFSQLTKLQLANNFIEEIESLENLPNLQFLDLSFNYIKAIKCLTDIRNLVFLNLSFNEITVLENMEHMTKLESFLVRHNKIKSFVNVYYLKQFKTLSCLGVEGNPFAEHHNTRTKIIANLPQLKFLDFQIVTEKELQTALLGFQSCCDERDRNKCLLPNPECMSVDSSRSLSSFVTEPSDKEAFVENLANGEGFESLLKNDKNFEALHAFLPVAHIAEDHRDKVGKVFDEWCCNGRKFYKQMQKEKGEFIEMMKKVQKFSTSLMEEEYHKFINVKEEIPKELCFIYQKHMSPEQKEVMVQELKEKYAFELINTHKNLVNASCLCMDLVYKLWKTFEREILAITCNYLKTVQEYCDIIMKIDETCISQYRDFYADVFNTGANFDLEFRSQSNNHRQLGSIFSQLLTKKEYVEMALKMTLSIHSTLLQERISKLNVSLEYFKVETENEVILNDVLLKQNEVARDIVVFCRKQNYITEKLFSNSEIFKRYLGYA